jgi:hypothetical protein
MNSNSSLADPLESKKPTTMILMKTSRREEARDLIAVEEAVFSRTLKKLNEQFCLTFELQVKK